MKIYKMLSVITSFMIVFLLSSMVFAEVNTTGMGVYSSGSRMGLLTKFNANKGWIKSGEGQMMMGSESSTYNIASKDSDGNTVTTVVNPWYFSTIDDGMIKQLNSRVGQYVVLEYKQARIKSPKVDTEYEITGIKEISAPKTEGCTTKSYVKGMKSSDASLIGRVVKTTTKGTIAKSWEVLIQEGDAGNRFKNMSISDDEKLYQCATEFLNAGQRVKITYAESFTNIGHVTDRDSNTDIISIEPLTAGKGLN